MKETTATTTTDKQGDGNVRPPAPQPNPPQLIPASHLCYKPAMPTRALLFLFLVSPSISQCAQLRCAWLLNAVAQHLDPPVFVTQRDRNIEIRAFEMEPLIQHLQSVLVSIQQDTPSLPRVREAAPSQVGDRFVAGPSLTEYQLSLIKSRWLSLYHRSKSNDPNAPLFLPAPGFTQGAAAVQHDLNFLLDIADKNASLPRRLRNAGAGLVVFGGSVTALNLNMGMSGDLDLFSAAVGTCLAGGATLVGVKMCLDSLTLGLGNYFAEDWVKLQPMRDFVATFSEPNRRRGLAWLYFSAIEWEVDIIVHSPIEREPLAVVVISRPQTELVP